MTVVSLILMLVVIPAVIGYFLYMEHLDKGITSSMVTFCGNYLPGFFRDRIEPGDLLVYRKPKASPHPGPRARNVHPSENGDDYYYEVDKFWAVADVLDDGRLVAVTRTGKRIYLTPKDERLRKPGLIERMRYRGRFPAV